MQQHKPSNMETYSLENLEMRATALYYNESEWFNTPGCKRVLANVFFFKMLSESFHDK